MGDGIGRDGPNPMNDETTGAVDKCPHLTGTGTV